MISLVSGSRIQLNLPMTRFGKNFIWLFYMLTWDLTKRTDEINFLDINNSIIDGIINTQLYKKALNLYLYLPPHSAHALPFFEFND